MFQRLLCSFILLFIISSVYSQSNSSRFRVIYEWNYINFTWPDENTYQIALDTRAYIIKNVQISGIKYYDNYLYLTIPRMRKGIPVTLARIPYNAKDTNTAPLLEPYPSWKMNLEADCTAIQNAQNIEIDTNGLLYILDSGRSNTLTNKPTTYCRPRLIVIDLETNQKVVDYSFPESVTSNNTFIYDLVLDSANGGYVYITDNSGISPGIIVYSVKQKKSWKIRDETMKAQSEAISFSVNGTSLSASINIAGIALGPRITVVENNHTFVSQDRLVYYCPLSSYRLYTVNSAVLRDESSAVNGISKYVKDLGRKASQSDGIIMDENGVLYYGLLADSSIAKWDSKTPFTSEQVIIARDKMFIQWPKSFAFDTNGNLFTITNRLQRFIYGQVNINESNYRILEGYVGAKSYLYSTYSDLKFISSYDEVTTNFMDMENATNSSFKLYYESQTMKKNIYLNCSENSANILNMKISILIVMIIFLINMH